MGRDEPDFLTRQLITCLGNKRALTAPIGDAVRAVYAESARPRLRILDAFAGSGVVSRLLKPFAAELVVNDLEDYAAVVARCFLTNRADCPAGELAGIVERLNGAVNDHAGGGFIERLYAPADEDAITSRDRVFYTRDNARRLDAYRQLIADEPVEYRDWLLGPLLSEASVHANTAGVFKGFYKDRATGIGRFGGSGADALARIRGSIRLECPVLSAFDADVEVFQSDANVLVEQVGDFDLAYFDPPYNEHPYGSNYFMLNLLTTYVEPTDVSRVSGIPADWVRSGYNVRRKSLPLLEHLLDRVDARFVLLSYNDEGFVGVDDMRAVLARLGDVREVSTEYRTFRGSRNLAARRLTVTEHLFLLEKRKARR